LPTYSHHTLFLYAAAAYAGTPMLLALCRRIKDEDYLGGV